MRTIRTFFSRHRRTLFTLLFLVLYTTTVSYAIPPSSPYAPGATLDPSCVPGSTNCSVEIIPSQTGHTGKYLTTNGSALSWGTVTIPTITANNGLTKVSDDIRLGGTLSANTTVDASTFDFSLTSGDDYFKFLPDTIAPALDTFFNGSSGSGSFYIDSQGAYSLINAGSVDASFSLFSEGLDESAFAELYVEGTNFHNRIYIDRDEGISITSGPNSGTQKGIRIFNTSGNVRLDNYGDGTVTGTPTYILQIDTNGNVIEGSLGTYILNQFAGAQSTSNFWIDGNARIDGELRLSLSDQGVFTFQNGGKSYFADEVLIGSTTDLGTYSLQVNGNVIVNSGIISVPGAGANSERFGLSSLSAGTDSLAVGNGASAAEIESTAIGRLAVTGSSNAREGAVAIGYTASAYDDSVAVGGQATANVITGVAVGWGSAASSNSSAALGYLATASGGSSVAIGAQAVGSGAGGGGGIAIGFASTAAGANSMALGAQSSTAGDDYGIALGFGASTTASNQMVIGADDGGGSGFINNLFVGEGVTNTTPTGFTLNATGGSGTNVSGANIAIASGKATGNASAGSILFQTSDIGASGTTLQTLSSKMAIAANGSVQLHNYGDGAFTGTPTYVLQVDSSGNIIEGSASVPMSSLTAATGSNSINNADLTQEWQWNTLSATGLKLSSTSTLATASSQKLLELSLSGANATANETTYGIYSSNTHTGSGNTINFGVYGTVSNGISAGAGVYGVASGSQLGVRGTSTSGYGGYFNSPSGIGLYSETVSGTTSALINANPSSTSTLQSVMRIARTTSSTAADGIGGVVEFYVETDSGGAAGLLSNELISKWTTATTASRTSQFIITGVNSGTTGDKFTLSGNGALKLNAYGAGTFTGTPTYVLQVDSSGNIIEGSASGTYVQNQFSAAQTSTDFWIGGRGRIDGAGLGIGVTPTAYLHMKAGTTAAGTAPLKFTSGSLMSTPETGAVEFLTDKWYGTLTSGVTPVRKEFTMNQGSLTGNTSNGRVPYAATGSSEGSAVRLTDNAALTFGLYNYLSLGNQFYSLNINSADTNRGLLTVGGGQNGVSSRYPPTAHFSRGSQTNQSAGIELHDIVFDFTGSRQWQTGSLTLQRNTIFMQPIYSFAGSSTLTDAANVAIAGAPQSSTNATITNTHGLLIQAGAVAPAGSVTNSYGLTVNAQTGGSNNYVAQFMGGSVGIGDATPDYLVDVASTTVDTNIFSLTDSDGECLHNPEAGSETVSCSSDERLKNNITDAQSALSYFDEIRIREYNVIATGDRMTGVIAQEMLEVHPELVTEDARGFYMVTMPNPWKVVKAIQELDVKITDIGDFNSQDDQSFVGKLRVWLANASNRITRIFTGELCLVDENGESECINRAQLTELKALLAEPPAPEAPPEEESEAFEEIPPPMESAPEVALPPEEPPQEEQSVPVEPESLPDETLSL